MPEPEAPTLIERAVNSARWHRMQGMDASAEVIGELAAALEATAAERDRAHATLREIAGGDDTWPEDLQRLARKRLENS